jgi:hypothetical protein
MKNPPHPEISSGRRLSNRGTLGNGGALGFLKRRFSISSFGNESGMACDGFRLLSGLRHVKPLFT